mmetsp:Transcript_37475/g.120659  ORF Transcript_37475/g.120659 Transcript_37475/m.120659 type:complete len:385 (+) Transcript_37475:117-1271(+)
MSQSAMAKQPTLRLRGTFIEVQDGSELMNCQMRRSFSEPCLAATSSVDDCAGFGQTKAYINNLSRTLACFNGNVRCSMLFFEGFGEGAIVADDLCSATVDNFSGSRCPQISSDAASDSRWQAVHLDTDDTVMKLTQCVTQNVEHTIVAERYPQGVTTNPPAINTSVANLLLKVKADARQPSALAKDSTSCASGSRLSWAEASEDCFDDGAVVAASPTGRCSRGSVGHPELCNRPCLFASGTCINGNDCDYCHMAHPKRPSHLDKRHRELLRSLSEQEWGSLVMPIVQRKLVAVDDSPESQAILGDIAACCGIQLGSEPAANAMLQRNQRMLILTLRSMSLKALLSTVQRCFAQRGQQLEAMLDTLLRRCLSMWAFEGVQSKREL